MKKVILICSIIAVTVSCSFGQDKADDLKTLFGLMKSENTIDQVMDNVVNVMKQQMQNEFKGEGDKAKYDEFVEFLTSEMKALTNKLMNEEMVAIYDKNFTHEEIKDLIAFYESPIGKKMIEKTPEISKQMMEAMMSKYLPDFQQKIIQKTQELKMGENKNE